MSFHDCHILAIFTGGPKTLVDACGAWQSSIARDWMEQPAQLEIRGFVGDQATQSYHGSPELASAFTHRAIMIFGTQRST